MGISVQIFWTGPDQELASKRDYAWTTIPGVNLRQKEGLRMASVVIWLHIVKKTVPEYAHITPLI